MLKPIRRAAVVPIGIALVALLALPAAVFANTSEAIAQTGGMSVTLPMPGAGLTVVVQLDNVGNISQVDLDPVGSYTAKQVGPHAVSFQNGDGTSQVRIKAKADTLAVKASAPTLASFVGSGTWSADVFGTGATTKVGYTVGDNAGKPTIAVVSVNAPGDIGVVQGAPVAKTGAKGSSASVRITFSRDGFTKKLDIGISVKAAGDHAASFKITLSGRDKQKLTGTLAELAAAVHSWSGHLCDGTAVSFTYSVVDNGTSGSVVFGAATGAPATSKAGMHGLSVRFDGTRTRVTVSLHDKKDGTWALKVTSQTPRCQHQPAPDPKVNTPIDPNAGKGGGHDGNGVGSGDRPGGDGGHPKG